MMQMRQNENPSQKRYLKQRKIRNHKALFDLDGIRLCQLMIQFAFVSFNFT